MKYNKRIFVILLASVLALCFVLVACKSNNDLTYTPVQDDSTLVIFVTDNASANNENTSARDNSIPEATQDNGNRIMPETGNETENDYFESYRDLITEWKAALNRYINDGYTINDTFDFCFYNGCTNSLKTYYALYDIDGNGITELLLKKQNEYEDIIAYIFTIKDDEPINLFGYSDEGLPREVPWSRAGSGKILNNGLIDCCDGDYTIYKIAESGYSVIKFASAQPYDYSDEAGKAEAKWKFYIDETEVDYDFYVQRLGEQGYMVNGNNTLANIDWKSVD